MKIIGRAYLEKLAYDSLHNGVNGGQTTSPQLPKLPGKNFNTQTSTNNATNPAPPSSNFRSPYLQPFSYPTSRNYKQQEAQQTQLRNQLSQQYGPAFMADQDRQIAEAEQKQKNQIQQERERYNQQVAKAQAYNAAVLPEGFWPTAMRDAKQLGSIYGKAALNAGTVIPDFANFAMWAGNEGAMNALPGGHLIREGLKSVGMYPNAPQISPYYRSFFEGTNYAANLTGDERWRVSHDDRYLGYGGAEMAAQGLVPFGGFSRAKNLVPTKNIKGISQGESILAHAAKTPQTNTQHGQGLQTLRTRGNTAFQREINKAVIAEDHEKAQRLYNQYASYTLANETAARQRELTPIENRYIDLIRERAETGVNTADAERLLSEYQKTLLESDYDTFSNVARSQGAESATLHTNNTSLHPLNLFYPKEITDHIRKTREITLNPSIFYDFKIDHAARTGNKLRPELESRFFAPAYTQAKNFARGRTSANFDRILGYSRPKTMPKTYLPNSEEAKLWEQLRKDDVETEALWKLLNGNDKVPDVSTVRAFGNGMPNNYAAFTHHLTRRGIKNNTAAPGSKPLHVIFNDGVDFDIPLPSNTPAPHELRHLKDALAAIKYNKKNKLFGSPRAADLAIEQDKSLIPLRYETRKLDKGTAELHANLGAQDLIEKHLASSDVPLSFEQQDLTTLIQKSMESYINNLVSDANKSPHHMKVCLARLEQLQKMYPNQTTLFEFVKNSLLK
jgi:hypothetical protein